MGMDEKVDEVLKQYELDIKAKRRVRGSVVVESGDEFYVVKPYLRDEMRILFEESVKECLYKNGYEFADFALKNKRGFVWREVGRKKMVSGTGL